MSFKVFLSAKTFVMWPDLLSVMIKVSKWESKLWVKRPSEVWNQCFLPLSDPLLQGWPVWLPFPSDWPKGSKTCPSPWSVHSEYPACRSQQENQPFTQCSAILEHQKRCSAYHNEIHNLKGQILVEFAFQQCCSWAQKTPQNLSCSLGPHSEVASHSIYSSVVQRKWAARPLIIAV